MFYDCPNLKYVDVCPLLSFYDYYENGEKMFNKNISQNGILVLDSLLYHRFYYIFEEFDIYPDCWTLNLVNSTIIDYY